MRLSSVFSGAAFRAACLSFCVFALVLAATGVFIHKRVEQSLLSELREQMIEELVLFKEIEQKGGMPALRETVADLLGASAPTQRTLGLFDENGQHMAGNEQIVPDFIGWKRTTLDALLPEASGEFLAHVVTAGHSHLVVGRSTAFIGAVLGALTHYLLVSGLVVAVASTLVGFLLSRRVDKRLEHMSDSLAEVSTGNLQARLDTGAGRDQITRVARQINGHLDRLALLMSSTRNTADAIAHDLRSPLSRVSLMLQDVMQRPLLDDAVSEQLEEVATELNGVRETFDTVLRISRIASNSDTQRFTVFALDVFLDEIAELFAPVAEARHQTLTCCSGSAPDLVIRGDHRMLRQMLVNLVENAICHCPAGTHILLESGQSDCGRPYLKVCDTGPGVPEAEHEKITDAFYRLDASRSSPGTGLGLALVKAIATCHEAELSLADNHPGLIVTLIFPAVD